MYLPIRHDRNIPSSFHKLHYFLAVPRRCCPARFRIRILLQSSEVFSIKSEVNLLELSLRGGPHREGVPFERNRPFPFEKRLTPDSQKGVFEGGRHERMVLLKGVEQVSQRAQYGTFRIVTHDFSI